MNIVIIISAAILLSINVIIVVYHFYSFQKEQKNYDAPLRVFKLKRVYRMYIVIPLLNSAIGFLATLTPELGIWIIFLIQMLNPVSWVANYYHIRLGMGGKKTLKSKLKNDRDVRRLFGCFDIQFMCKVSDRYQYQRVVNFFVAFVWMKPILICAENMLIVHNKDDVQMISYFTIATICCTSFAILGARSSLLNVKKYILIEGFQKKFMLSVLFVPFLQLQDAFLDQLVQAQYIQETDDLSAREHSYRWVGLLLSIETVFLNLAYLWLYDAKDFSELDYHYSTKFSSRKDYKANQRRLQEIDVELNWGNEIMRVRAESEASTVADELPVELCIES